MKNQNNLFVAVCIICLLSYRCNNSAVHTAISGDTLSQNNLYSGYATEAEWGKHLAVITGCGDCHTPKKMTDKGPIEDTSLLFAGHPSQIPTPVLMPNQLAKGMAATFDLTSWNGPWGTSYAANLMPDSTGIGAWTVDQFINCIRKGVFKGIDGSRPIMPPMPINDFQHMTDSELKALFTYFKTVNLVHNVVPEYQPPVAMK